MSETSPRLSFREKAGYSLGDAAANLVFQTMLYYQLTFYTDAFGITAAAAGTLFLVVRVWDAVFDPMMGAVADRTVSRWGKFRPWILGTAVPFGLLFWLAFHTPHLGGTGKLVYAYATYIALMMVYSANNLPYSALNAVMTGDSDDRTSLASFRFVAAMTASLVVQSFTLPLVAKFGHGDSSAGWSTTIGCFAVAAVIFFIITFLSSRERIRPAQTSAFKDDIRDLLNNGPWLAMFFVTLCVFITLALRGGSLNYYFTYYADRSSVFEFLRRRGFPLTTDPGHGFGSWLMEVVGLKLNPDASNAPGVIQWMFNLSGSVVTLLGVFSSRPLARRFGKKAVFLGGLAATTVVTALFVLPGRHAIGEMFLFSLLWPACYGPTIPILWVMIADVVDYSEWKTGRRATGFTYAGIVFALKAGLGVGGALGGILLGYYDYVPNAQQQPQALHGIKYSASLFPALFFAIAVVCVVLYPLGKALTEKIAAELESRRRSGTVAV